MIPMRLLLAAVLAAGLGFAPAAADAQDKAMSATSKQKTNRATKVQKKAPRISRPAAATKTTDSPLGEPYTMQKDEMTR
jgi:hypothetical protein